MRTTFALTLLALASSALSTVSLTPCVANDCLRAVRAKAYPTNTADCSSYFLTTVIPATTTHTKTVTATVAAEKREAAPTVAIEARATGAVTITPKSLQFYVTPCSGSVRYSSACSCIGVTAMTTTFPTPSVTVTFTKTVTKK